MSHSRISVRRVLGTGAELAGGLRYVPKNGRRRGRNVPKTRSSSGGGSKIVHQVEHDSGGPGGAAVTYQHELVRCGKARCKPCAGGGFPHGPYWYAYWSEGGRKRKRYIGRDFMTLREKDAAKKKRRAA